jgi:membrane protease YdiL (CAAX protease family)
MPVLLYFIVYLCVALFLTALFYYPVFHAMDAVWEVRPDRVFNRLAMVIAALGFWPFLKLLGINNRYALGYTLDRRQFLQTFSSGLFIGLMIMSGHAILLMLFGARMPVAGDIHFNDLLYALLSGLLSGILVAFIEESFFRGAMHYGMRRRSTLLTASIATALLYATVHFIHAPVPAEGTITGWQSGWEMLAAMFHSYENFAGIADSYTALFAAGLFLSLVRERTGNIALCIGIHAGWVLSIKLVREVTDAATNAPAAFLIGSYDGIIGWAAAAVLGLVTLWYWRYGGASR